MSKKVWLKAGALLVSGAVLFQNGCLSAFWDGFCNTGWPTDNLWMNLLVDVLNEELAG